MSNQVQAIIDSCHPSGCWAEETGSATKLWIPRQEVFWHHTLQDTWEVLSPGQPVTLSHLGLDEKGRQCCSYREVNANPWLSTELPTIGSIVEAEVTHIDKTGVHAVTKCGAEGWLPVADIIDWRDPDNGDIDPLDLFWLGDYVRVAVRRIDKRRRHLRFTMKPVFSSERHTLFSYHMVNSLHLMVLRRELEFVLNRETKPIKTSAAEQEELVEVWKRSFNGVLVVEDDDDDMRHLLSLMQDISTTPTTATSFSDAEEALSQHTFDLLILDIHLGIQNGLALLKTARARNAEIAAIVLTHDVTSARDFLHDLGSHARVRVLSKPASKYSLLVSAAVLSEALHSLTHTGSVTRQPQTHADTRELGARAVGNATVVDVLDSLRQQLQCAVAAVFAIDHRLETVRLVARSGTLSARECFQDRFRLRHTPIKDVILRKKAFTAIPVDEDDARFAIYRQTSLQRYTGFAGHHVAELDYQSFGLFTLFDSPPTVGISSIALACRVAAIACSHILARESMEGTLHSALNRARNWDRFRMGLHELSRELSKTPIRAEELARACGREDYFRVSALADNLNASAARSMASIRSITSSVTDGGDGDEIDLNVFVAERLYAFLDEAQGDDDDRPSVRLSFAPCQVPAAVTTSERGLGIILDNILDNGIKWARVNRSRIPSVAVSVDVAETQRDLFYVSVSDTGPGIHSRETRLLFEPYYTCREDGTGLGLAIASQVVEECDNITLYAVHGVIGTGTSFVIGVRGG